MDLIAVAVEKHGFLRVLALLALLSEQLQRSKVQHTRGDRQPGDQLDQRRMLGIYRKSPQRR